MHPPFSAPRARFRKSAAFLPTLTELQDSAAVLRERRQHCLSAERQRRNPAGADRHAGGRDRPSKGVQGASVPLLPVCSSVPEDIAQLRIEACRPARQVRRYPPELDALLLRLVGRSVRAGA